MNDGSRGKRGATIPEAGAYLVLNQSERRCEAHVQLFSLDRGSR